MIEFFRRRLVRPLMNLLQQGVTPEKLALSVGLGFALGIFPMLGTTTLLCGLFGYLFRVNQPAIQLVNYFIYPLQLALFIPYFNAGAWLFNQPSVFVSVGDLMTMMTTDLPGTIGKFWWNNVLAVGVWTLTAPPAGWVLFRLLRPVFTRLRSLHRT